MGTFHCSMELANINRDKFETVEVLAGTGCTFSYFPGSLLSRLGISQKERIQLERPHGAVVEMWLGQAWVRIDDREGPASVVFDDDDAPARLGSVTLSGLCIRIDPDENRLLKYLPRKKPPEWYERQRKLKEAIERIEAERGYTAIPESEE
jgi:predicted aspartyl protease